MELLIVIGVCVLWCMLFNVARDLHTQARHRREDRVMSDYLEAEDARYHHLRMAEIDATVERAKAEMARIAAEDRGDVLDGTCQEIEPR